MIGPSLASQASAGRPSGRALMVAVLVCLGLALIVLSPSAGQAQGVPCVGGLPVPDCTPSTTAPPTTQPPATQPPTTQPPTTQPPTAAPPKTQPPATQPAPGPPTSTTSPPPVTAPAEITTATVPQAPPATSSAPATASGPPLPAPASTTPPVALTPSSLATPPPSASVSGSGSSSGSGSGTRSGTETGAATSSPSTSPAVYTPPVVTFAGSLATVLSGSFLLLTLGLVGLAFLLSFMAGHARRGRIVTMASVLGPGTTFTSAVASPSPIPSTGATPMSSARTNRLPIALGTLLAAAVVAVVGWYKLSGQPQLNQQIPYLASAGLAVVILAAIGGSLLVAEQLRGDERRMEELEEAVRSLAATLSPLIEAPARRQLGHEDPIEAPDVPSRSRRPARGEPAGAEPARGEDDDYLSKPEATAVLTRATNSGRGGRRAPVGAGEGLGPLTVPRRTRPLTADRQV